MKPETRRIRPAGRTTGSVELTLPRALRELEGIKCEVGLNDGDRPEITLRPDLAPALATVEGLWQALRRSLAPLKDIGDFPWEGMDLALFPAGYRPGRTSLSYLDVLRATNGHKPETATPQDRAAALSNVVAALSVQAGLRLGLEEERALLVSAIVSYVCTGLIATGLAGSLAEVVHQAVPTRAGTVEVQEVLTEGRLPEPIAKSLLAVLERVVAGKFQHGPPTTLGEQVNQRPEPAFRYTG